MEESDPSVFVPSAEALAALSEEEAAIAGEGMVRVFLIISLRINKLFFFYRLR